MSTTEPVITDEMRKAVEQALDFHRGMMEEGIRIITAHGFVHEPDGKFAVFAIEGRLMEDWRTKNKIAAMLIRELFERKGTAMTFVSDAWMATGEHAKHRAEMPNSLADWPEHMRTETLFCCVNQIGQRGVFVPQHYKRDGKQFIWSPIDWDFGKNLAMSSRFVFDLTHGNMRRAIAEALAKNREGDVAGYDGVPEWN